MRKMIALAFAALLSAGVASAITVSWDGVASREITGVDYTKDITVAYAYTVDGAVSARRDYLWLGFDSAGKDETNALEFRYAPAFGGPVLLNSANSSAQNRVALTGALGSAGARELTFTFNLAGRTCTVTWMDADSQYQTTTLTLRDGLTYDKTLWVESLAPTGLTASSTSVTYTAVVPEPTALAFLALGVAGLALRRKVR